MQKYAAVLAVLMGLCAWADSSFFGTRSVDSILEDHEHSETHQEKETDALLEGKATAAALLALGAEKERRGEYNAAVAAYVAALIRSKLPLPAAHYALARVFAAHGSDTDPEHYGGTAHFDAIAHLAEAVKLDRKLQAKALAEPDLLPLHADQDFAFLVGATSLKTRTALCVGARLIGTPDPSNVLFLDAKGVARRCGRDGACVSGSWALDHDSFTTHFGAEETSFNVSTTLVAPWRTHADHILAP